MAEINLTQAEADALLAMEKHRADESYRDFPSAGHGVAIPLHSPDRRESFLLDIYRGRISTAKVTYQNRGRSVVTLARLDIAGPPHRNPDGQELQCPHLHLYREGFGDKWAFPVPSTFTDVADPWATLDDFQRYCNITQPPHILRALFT